MNLQKQQFQGEATPSIFRDFLKQLLYPSIFMSSFERNAFVVGVTGGIACGKSAVGSILDRMGFVVCDADLIAHDLMRAGRPVFTQVVDVFGKGILAEDGEICRSVLAKVVFQNPEQREILNRIVHPVIRAVLIERIEKYRSERKKAAVLIPLLFESGMQDLGWDAVVCVSSSKDAVLQRLEKRGLSTAEAEQRIRSQMPLAQKEKLADYVVPNIGTLVELELAVRQFVEAVAGER